MHEFIIQIFWNIDHINPKYRCWCCYLDIKDHEFMMRSVINTFLDSFWSSYKVWMFLGPCTTKIFTINLNDFCFRKSLFNLLENMIKMIMNFFDCISCIIESLIEIISRILAWNRDLFGEKIRSSSILCNFIFPKVMHREIRPMYFFGSNPKYIRFIMAISSDFINKLIPSR